MNYRFRVQVKGRVQGVFFRKTTNEKAHGLQLTGWVKNQADGSVLFECQGILEQCFSLMAWSQFGPPMAEPTHIEIEQIKAIPDESEFRIEY